MNVLIADDSSTIRTCIRDMLKEVPRVNIVAEVSNARDAVELIESNRPDVAILDIRMPGGGGLEVLRAIREKACSPVTIVLTNYPYPEYRRKCMEAGAEFFFDKSSDFDRVPSVLKMLMEGRGVRESSRHVALEQLVSLSEETQRLADVELRHEATETQLRRRGTIMHAVGYAADRLLQTQSWRTNAAAVIQQLGHASESSRVTLFNLQPDTDGTPTLNVVCGWSDSSLATQVDIHERNQKHLCATMLAHWKKALSAGSVIQRLASSCGHAELSELSRKQVLSIVVIPVFVDSEWWGIMSFEECRVEREWSAEEVEALRAAASTLGAAIRRETMERDLAFSEAKYRNLVDLLPQIVFEMDTDGIVRFCNQQGYRAFGYSREDIQHGRVGVRDLFKPEDQIHVRELVEAILSGRDVGGQELEIRRSDGTSFPIIAYATAIMRNDSPAGLRGIAVDITERKETEERIRLAKEEWERTFDAVPELVFIIDEAYRIRRVNLAVVTRFGLAFEDILGRTCHDVFHDSHEPANACPRCRALHDGNIHQTELFLKQVRGSFLLSVSPLGSDGDTTGWVYVASDITELKATQHALQEYSDNLQTMVEERTAELRDAQAQLVHREKLAVLSQLSAGVGHELRNPLGVISNAVYYLKTIQPEAPEKVKEYLDIIRAEVSNTKQIVSRLLDFSLIRNTNPGKIALRSLVTKLIEKHPPPKGVQVDIIVPTEIPPVVSDLDHVNQILSNLVINAYQAMPHGGRLALEANQLDEREASITVRDNGCGISKKELDKVFDPLFTTKARGIGLGLTLSLNLAKANGGRIEMSSEDGKGAAFTLILPVAERSNREGHE